MNNEFPPLQLHEPTFKRRRKEKLPFPLLRPEIRSKRGEIAQRLQQEISRVSSEIQQLSPQQRRAIFLKLSHERPLTPRELSGTDLKLISPPSEHCSLVIPRREDADLSKLVEKVREFGEDPIPDNRNPKNSPLVTNVKHVSIGVPTDRLSEELFNNYKKLIKRSFVKIEIELVSNERSPKQQEEEVKKIIEQLRGLLRNIGAVYEFDLTYGSARVCIGLPGRVFRDLVEHPQWQRVITFFDARPQFETYHTAIKTFNSSQQTLLPPPDDACTVCIVDSGISDGNPFLAPTVRKDLLKSFVPGKEENPSDENGHGSGVASLAAYYAIDIEAEATNRAKVWIAGARILNAQGQLDGPEPDDIDVDIEQYRAQQARLLSSILRDVVDYFLPHGIRIFVLSFNIVNRLWNQDGRRTVPRTSWVARTIDQISRDKDILFVTITGNLRPDEISHLLQEKKNCKYPEYLMTMPARLQDPGHSALSVTVGSIAHAGKVIGPATGFPMAEPGQPSPFSRSGPGITGGIKPDVVERGGNVLVDAANHSVSRNLGTDIVMASNKLSPSLHHDSGTSFAAPRVAHHLALIEQSLRGIGVKASACLLRAFLANSARWDSPINSGWLAENLGDKRWLTVVGLGLPDAERAMLCDRNTVVMYYDGQISPNQVAFFDICIPSVLASTGRLRKRLYISLAYAPPIQRRGLDDYLGVQLKYRLFRGDTSPQTLEEVMGLDEEEENSTRDAESHMPGQIGLNIRSKGTLQHDIFEWNDHDIKWNTHNYTLAVAAYTPKWTSADAPIRMAIVVKLELEEQRLIDIYAEVEAALAVEART